MSMVVRNNDTTNLLRRELRKSSNEAASHLNKVSTEMKINSAGDSAAEYAISERMRCKLHGLDQALSNAQTSNNVLKRASGAVGDQIDLMKRIHTLAIQAADDTRIDEDRAILQKDIGQMLSQIDNIARETTYNGYQLLDQKMNLTDPADTCAPEYRLTLQTNPLASQSTSVYLANTTLNMLFPASSEHWHLEPKESDYPAELRLPQNGSASPVQPVTPDDRSGGQSAVPAPAADSPSISEISQDLQAKRDAWKKDNWRYPARTVNLDASNCIRSSEAAKVFLEDAGQALKYLLHVNTTFGAQSMRLEKTGDNLLNQSETLQNSESTIRDADMASEVVGLTKANVLASSSRALLAQANQKSDGVMGLLA